MSPIVFLFGLGAFFLGQSLPVSASEAGAELGPPAAKKAQTQKKPKKQAKPSPAKDLSPAEIRKLRSKNKAKNLKLDRATLFISLRQLDYRSGKIDPIDPELQKTMIKTYEIERIFHPNELDGAYIETEGYGVPLEMAEYVKEFMFVGNQMYCSHQTPPPPNQAIHVKVKVTDSFKGIPMNKFGDVTPFKIRGRLKVIREKKRLYEAGYELEATWAEAGKATWNHRF